MGLPADARFAHNADRVANRAALSALITQLTRTWARDALLAALASAQVPAGPINTVAQALNDPQIAHRGMVLSLKRGDGSAALPGLRTLIRFSGAELNLETPAPLFPGGPGGPSGPGGPG